MSTAISLKFIAASGSYRLIGDGPFVKEANDYLNYSDMRNLSVLTVRSYGHDLVGLIRWLRLTGCETVEALRSVDFVKFLGYMKGEGLHPSSINHRFFTSIVFYQFVFGEKPRLPFPQTKRRRRWYRYVSSPSLCKIKVPRRLIEPLKPHQVRSFLDQCTKYRDLAIVSLMLSCGLRSKEVLTLRLQNVDLLNGAVRVIGKGNQERRVPIAEDLAHALSRYLDVERPRNSPSDCLFVVLQGSNRGESMCYAGLRSLFRARRATLATSRANPHRFRHTFGTDMAKAGVKLPTLQKLMGHAHLETTMKYINFSMTDVHEEYRRIIAKIQAQYHQS